MVNRTRFLLQVGKLPQAPVDSLCKIAKNPPLIKGISALTSESPSYVQLPEVLPVLSASVDDSESRPGSPPCDLPTVHRRLRPPLGLHFFGGHRAYGHGASTYIRPRQAFRCRRSVRPQAWR